MDVESFEIPCRYLISVVDAASEHGIDLNGFLLTQGLSRDSLQLPEATIKSGTYLKAIAFVQSRYRDEKPFSLEVVRHTTLTNHGLLSLACLCAPNYLSALELVQEYSKLILPIISLSLHQKHNDCCVRIQSSAQFPELSDVLMEIILGFFYAGKILTGIPPKKVTLAHTPTFPIKYYEEFWGCPVLTNQPYYQLCLQQELLYVAPPTANPENFVRLKRQLQEQSNSESSISTLRLQIEKLLLQSTEGHFLNLAEMADALCISPRTLRRRLEKENCSYKQLVNVVRQRIAEQQLRNLNIPIGQISRNLGFASDAGFSRAFKTWSGLSPQEYRQRVSQEPSINTQSGD